MKWIKIVSDKISKNFKDKMISILVVLCTNIPYIYLLNILIMCSLELIYLIQKGEHFKSEYPHPREFNFLFYITFIIISPLSLANYFYNDSKFSNVKTSTIRFIIMVIGSTILLGSFLVWLGRFKIINLDLNLLLDKYRYLIIHSAIIFELFVLMIIKIFKPNDIPWGLYLLAHFLWILALFFIISSMIYLENESTIFSKTNFIILTTLTFIAVTYSCFQQYLYKILRKLIAQDNILDNK